MSIANFYNYVTKEVTVPNLEIDGVLELHNVPFNGGGSGSVAGALSYINTTSQSVTIGTNQLLNLGSLDPVNSFGTTDLSYSNGKITNNSASSIFVLITGFCVFSSSGSGSYALWMSRNANNSVDRYGYTETADDNDFVSINFSTSLQLAPNDYVSLYCWSNNSTGILAGVGTFPGLRFTISQLNQETGGGGSNTETLSQCLILGNDAGNQSITNVNALSMNGYLSVGNSSVSSGQIHLGYNSGSNVANNYQITAIDDELNFELYNQNGLYRNCLNLLGNGNVVLGDTLGQCAVFVTSSSGALGRVYDDTYNVPPSGSLTEYTKNFSFAYYSGTCNFLNNSYAPAMQFNLSGFPSDIHHYKLIFNNGFQIQQSSNSVNTIWFYLVDSNNTNSSQSAIITNCPAPFVITLTGTSTQSFNNSPYIEFYSSTSLQNGLQLIAYVASGTRTNTFPIFSGQCTLIGMSSSVTTLTSGNLP